LIQQALVDLLQLPLLRLFLLQLQLLQLHHFRIAVGPVCIIVVRPSRHHGLPVAGPILIQHFLPWWDVLGGNQEGVGPPQQVEHIQLQAQQAGML
jgi:hypothetical protein